MKEINELDLPDNLRYSENHVWALLDGEKIRVGISDYAQDQLGDIVYIDLPKAGDSFEKGKEFGVVESVKAVNDLYMPVGGEIIAVNPELEDSPEIVNGSPYSDGWLIEVKPDDPGEIDALMKRDAYIAMLEEMAAEYA